MNEKSYLTVQTPAKAELTVEHSRFIGHCREVASETEAKAFIAQIRAENSQANHNCYAYRLGAGKDPLEYYNDHGEPSGTAGKPILGAIERLKLTNVVVVVTRYFGGKKLGVRGLIDAYGQTATLVLKTAGSCVRIPTFCTTLTCSYADHYLILHRLKQVDPTVADTGFTASVTLHLVIPEANRTVFESILKELPVQDVSYTD